jgi:hypothetical protein
MISELDRLYAQFLSVGFVVLRQASDAGDSEWLASELELLHNVPSLIGEANPKRHEHFWSQERTRYIQWANASGREVPRSRMQTFYAPIWQAMEPIVTVAAPVGRRSST